MNAPAMVLTDRAATKVRQLRDGEGSADLLLRVYVTGGGCSGFSYGFTFAEAANDDDARIENGDVENVSPKKLQALAKGLGESEEHIFSLVRGKKIDTGKIANVGKAIPNK